MIKRLKNLFFFLVFSLLLLNCSFDNKTGIWAGGEKEKLKALELERQQKKVLEVVKIYSSERPAIVEIVPVKNTTLTQPVKNSSWSMSGLNLQNFTGNIYFNGINKKFLKKKIGKDKFEISQVMSSPLYYNGYIYFSDDVGNIFSVTKRGKLNWKKNIYKKVYKKIYKNLSLSIYKNKIYVADNIGFVYVIDLENGKILWIKNHGIPFKSRIKIYKEKIYLINQDNRLVSFDIDKGAKIWDIRTLKSFIKSQNFLSLAISKTGDLVMVNSSGDLVKLNADTGKIYWSLNVTASMLAHATDFFKTSDLLLSDDDIIFSDSESIFSFNLENGYLNWSNAIGTENTPILDGTNVFMVTNDGFLVNLDKDSGKINWAVNTFKILKEKKRKTETTGFVMGSGKIYITTLNGYIIVCSAVTGKVEYSKKIGERIAAPPIISDASLYILTENSRIIGFN